MSPTRVLRDLSVRTKLLGLNVVVGAGFLAIVLVATGVLYVNLYREKTDEISRLAVIAQQVIEQYVALEKDGALDGEAARTQAMEMLRSIEYEGGGYFWINDMDGIMLMHPVKSELQGQDVQTIEDADGQIIFVDMIDLVRREGGGRYEYSWPPGEDARTKVSYVQGVPEWGWIVGTGIYVDDVSGMVWRAVLWIGGLGAFVLAVVIAATVWLVRIVVSPVRGLTGSMQTLAENNLTIDVPYRERQDELGAMARAVGVFKDNMIRADQLDKDAEELRKAREQRAEVREAASQSFDRDMQELLKVVSGAIEQMQGTSQSLSVSAEQANGEATPGATAAEQASVNVQAVAAASEQLANSIQEISRQVASQSTVAASASEGMSAADGQVRDLSDGVEKIGEIVTLITSIAEQTNLLALNATIEAARAGDAGKGFAVVAAEVKGLASQTAKATEEISTQIHQIQEQTGGTVRAIEAVSGRINEMTEIAATVASAVEEQNAATGEIGHSIGQAANGADEVSRSIQGVTAAAAETGQASGDVLEASNALAGQADQLKQRVEGFLAEIRAA